MGVPCSIRAGGRVCGLCHMPVALPSLLQVSQILQDNSSLLQPELLMARGSLILEQAEDEKLEQ